MESDKMATIPYIEHEYRIFKAYKRETKWKISFVVSNCLWLAGLILLLTR